MSTTEPPRATPESVVPRGTHRIQANTEVWLPFVPDSLAIKGGGTVKVSQVSEECLREIGAAWTEALVAKR